MNFHYTEKISILKLEIKRRSLYMDKILKKLGIEKTNYGVSTGCRWLKTHGEELVSYSPVTGEKLGSIIQANAADYEQLMKISSKGLKKWQVLTAPIRGQIVREIGEALRKFKKPLGTLVTMEMGKLQSEGEGEVQEMIDIADFSTGLSRQLYGLTMHSERPFHRMYEQWHPLGIIGVITAFNFPVAVWSWNSLIAGVCGDAVIWKPSSKTPLCTVAVQNIISPVMKKYEIEGVFNAIIGKGSEVGEIILKDRRLPLISATGSCHMGRKVNQFVGERLGRALLELGGNNAVIVSQYSNLEMAVKGVLFGAIGTAAQRCTSTRRVIVHKDIKNTFLKMLLKAYEMIGVGDPRIEGNLMGPLVDRKSIDDMMNAIEIAEKQGGKVLCRGQNLKINGLEDGHYVTPALIEVSGNLDIVKDETFAPILYIMSYDKLSEALELNNEVPQGLSSSIFTDSLRESEFFLSQNGSDCGLSNVNTGTSGAEIGGAFGGEKDTGGGRESGSDSWKIYMRRQTSTINWSGKITLAQGVEFNLGENNG